MRDKWCLRMSQLSALASQVCLGTPTCLNFRGSRLCTRAGILTGFKVQFLGVRLSVEIELKKASF